MPPDWTDLPKKCLGVSPSIKGLDIGLNGLFFQNNDGPAKITVFFDNNAKIDLMIGEKAELFALIFDSQGKIILNKSQALINEMSEINILPQIGPLKDKEDLLTEEYVKYNIFSNLASLHFRNQLIHLGQYFNKFKELSESSWEGLKIIRFEKGSQLNDEPPFLLVEDSNFIGEIATMGHGLQMWLQTMWFLARCDKNSIVILDEPDVYLHADMQRNLINFFRCKFKQAIIATHSIEIISDVEPLNILVVKRENNESVFLDGVPGVQQIIESLGSVHNLELIRYWSAKKFIFLEGKKDDLKILEILQKLFTLSPLNLSSIPVGYTDGWSGWERVIGLNIGLKNTGVETYCVFDSDYHLPDEIENRLLSAGKNNIKIHIWDKKEIENYLIIPAAVLRYIKKQAHIGNPTLQLINSKVLGIAEEIKNDIVDNISDEIKKSDRGLSVSTCNKKAREMVNTKWQHPDDILTIIPGKQVLSSLSDWSKQEFNVSFSKFQIASELIESEINNEIIRVLKFLQT